jgi:tRNA (adenine57-N1/adenine58-N1)-methyltransferase
MKKAKILVRKGKRQYFEDLYKEVTIISERSFYINDLSKDYSTEQGMIKKADLAKNGLVKTNKGKEFYLFDADFMDVFRHLRRMPQMIPPKDVGYILLSADIGPESIVVEGGAGSGGLGLILARYCKKVYSYDIDKDNLALVKENAEVMGIKNITLKNKSLYEGISEKDVDAVCLDVPEPWRAVKSVSESLRAGGHVVSYSPTIIQSNQFVDAIADLGGFIHVRTVELLERPWLAERKRVRPISKEIMHSGFITICRKIV